MPSKYTGPFREPSGCPLLGLMNTDSYINAWCQKMLRKLCELKDCTHNNHRAIPSQIVLYVPSYIHQPSIPIKSSQGFIFFVIRSGKDCKSGN